MRKHQRTPHQAAIDRAAAIVILACLIVAALAGAFG